MSTVETVFQWLTSLGNPWVFWPLALILLAIVLWRLRTGILTRATKLATNLAPRFRKTTFWLQRYYLWLVVPTALLGYLAIILTITWELPLIADATVARLRAAVDATTPEASTDVRNYAYALGALLAGIAFLATVPFQLIKTWVNERQATTAEQGHITDRLTKAIEQLGAEKTTKTTAFDETYPTKVIEETVPNLEVSLGAIYALERIAQDSERDHITVMETLCAYIRENAPASGARDHDLGDWPEYPETEQTAPPTEQSDPSNDPSFPRRLDSPADSETDPGLRADDGSRSTGIHETRDALLKDRRQKLDAWANALPAPRVDIKATLTVIGRRRDERIEFERRQERPFALDLRRTNLQNADLRLAKFDRAFLTHARMERANLFQARMEGAYLGGAQMEGAYLGGARMEGADLGEARM